MGVVGLVRVNRKKWLYIGAITVGAVLLLCVCGFIIAKYAYLCARPLPLADMDYIVNNDTGEVITLTTVETIEPALWKGSRDGTLYFYNGRSIEVEISSYGDFFAIKGERPDLFSGGTLYHYNAGDEE